MVIYLQGTITGDRLPLTCYISGQLAVAGEGEGAGEPLQRVYGIAHRAYSVQDAHYTGFIVYYNYKSMCVYRMYSTKGCRIFLMYCSIQNVLRVWLIIYRVIIIQNRLYRTLIRLYFRAVVLTILSIFCRTDTCSYVHSPNLRISVICIDELLTENG